MRGKSKSTLAIEEAIDEIVGERAPITVRGVCYALFVKGLIDSMNVNNTGRISRVMTAMRECGDLDWQLIVDGTRSVDRARTWRDTSSLIRAATAQYRRDYWQDQPALVEVWSEKSTVAGVLQRVLEEYGCTFRVMKGFGSYTSVRQGAEDSLAGCEDQDHIVLYLGDFDPSGLWMSEEDLPQRLERYGSQWRFQRIAIMPEDTESLPSFDVGTKSGDARYSWYVRQYGHRAWELDAMDPNDLRERVESEIKSRLDMNLWKHAIKIERAEIESMKDFQATWEQMKTSRDLLHGGA